MARKQNRAILCGGRDPRSAPAYTFSEVARYLRFPVDTLRNWALGHGTFRPVFELDDKNAGYLSFWNVVEAHVLSGIRRQYGVKLPMVRSALEYVQQNLGVERPLIEPVFQTDGRSLFVDRYGELINASTKGQLVMEGLLLAQLKRIDRDECGLPIRLYPFTRPVDADSSRVDQPRVVVMNPRISFGRPAVRGVATSVIWGRYRAGDSIAHLAEDYGLTTEEIEEAIRCEAA